MDATTNFPWIADSRVDENDHVQLDVDHLPLGVTLIDNDYRFRRFNRAYAEMIKSNTPLSLEQARGRNYFDCLAGSKQKAEPIMQRVMATRKPFRLQREELPISINGKLMFTYWNGEITPVIEKSGHVSGILLMCLEAVELRSASPRGRVLGALNNEPSLKSDDQITFGPGDPALTFKEEQVARLVMEGLSSKEIAARLNLSKAAIDSRRNVIRKKLEISGQPRNLYAHLRQLN